MEGNRDFRFLVKRELFGLRQALIELDKCVTIGKDIVVLRASRLVGIYRDVDSRFVGAGEDLIDVVPTPSQPG